MPAPESIALPLLRLIHTPIGVLKAEATASGVLRIDFLSKAPQVRASAPESPFHERISPLLDQLDQELKEYFEKKRRHFTVPIDWEALSPTPFQLKAWHALQNIPYGKTLSYREQAALIRHPRAVRAVGSANAANPLPLLIPCHRVIRTDRTPGGYAGGAGIKRALLELEGGLR
jgi:methylated-DNA-[protein]-cysteine S-methyltransferase